MTSPRATQRGFSVLEALIAVAILGFAFSALLMWRLTLVRQHAHVSALESEVTAQRNALALLREINPMATPTGTMEISPGVAVSWRATPLSEISRSVAYPAGDGAFDVALYRLDVAVQHAQDAPTTFSIERLGWVRRDAR